MTEINETAEARLQKIGSDFTLHTEEGGMPAHNSLLLDQLDTLSCVLRSLQEERYANVLDKLSGLAWDAAICSASTNNGLMVKVTLLDILLDESTDDAVGTLMRSLIDDLLLSHPPEHVIPRSGSS